MRSQALIVSPNHIEDSDANLGCFNIYKTYLFITKTGYANWIYSVSFFEDDSKYFAKSTVMPKYIFQYRDLNLVSSTKLGTGPRFADI